jgi:FixJ family two-component response regulator
MLSFISKGRTLDPSVKKKCAPFSEESPYSFLERTIEICMVDDDPNILELYSKILNCYPLYTAATFSSASEANVILSSIKRFHVCVMDLGLADINNDEFYLVKTFSPQTSFVILTGKGSIQTGFQCGKNGSFSVFEKPVDFRKTEFINTVNEAFIYSLVNTGKEKHCKPIIEKIIEALIFCYPANINEWAYNACVTEQYLRRVWNTIYGYQPKYFLWFYKMMTSAFSFYNEAFLKMNGVFVPPADQRLETIEKEALPAVKYFNSHKDVFNAILNGKT